MKTLTTLCGAALLLCGAMFAQSYGDRMTVRFSTPVTVGETRFPAGECDIQVMRSSSDSIVLVMRSQDGPYASVLASHITDSHVDTDAGHASVVLDRHGDTYRLNRIILPDHTGYQLNIE
jgi:hypothetical protein